jgi:hypothetical protein
MAEKRVWESNYKFDFWPLKVKNRPDLFVCRWCATYPWKNFDEGYNSASYLTSTGGLSKVARVPILRISGLPAWESRDKMTFGCKPHGQAQKIL